MNFRAGENTLKIPDSCSLSLEFLRKRSKPAGFSPDGFTNKKMITILLPEFVMFLYLSEGQL